MYPYRIIYNLDHEEKELIRVRPEKLARELVELANANGCNVDLSYRGRLVTAVPRGSPNACEKAILQLVAAMHYRGMTA